MFNADGRDVCAGWWRGGVRVFLGGEIEGILAGRGGMRVMWGVLRGKTVAGEWYNAAMFDGRER